MGLYEKSKSLIISMNLCSIKNMIQLSALDFHDIVKSKRLSDTKRNGAFKMSERNKNTSSKQPNQYAKVKNTAKGEEEVQDVTNHNRGFVDEFLEEGLNTSNIHEAQQDTDYDFWISNHNVHTSIGIGNTL
jgi:hypothetical protein